MKRIACILLLLGYCAARPQESHQHTAPEKLGKVEFFTSCAAKVQSRFNRAVALLHSFAYAPAVEAFTQIAHDDPGCAMANWGVAMSYYHQLWEPAFPGDTLEKAKTALEQAQKVRGGTPREKEYIAAAGLLLTPNDAYPARSARYRDAMAALAEHHREDVEAQIFYALALLATANPQDKSHQNQKAAAKILLPLYQKYPQHPGLAHYLIHADDNAELAKDGLKAAQEYSQIAPSAPHALHMPSHIFTRLGMWSDSVKSNQSARAAAHAQGDAGEELHAMDYLVYASLQEGRDDQAAAVLKDLNAMGLVSAKEFKIAYSATAMPVRYAVERKNWDAAIHCSAPEGAPPHVSALAAWARALGKTRSGDVTAAKVDVDSMQKLAEQLRAAGNLYWAGQVDIQLGEARSWIAAAENKPEEAVALMAKAANDEDAVEKLPVTPGPVVPAREQLADLLAQLGRHDAALAEYEKSLQASPGRRGALQGALQSARAAGMKSKTSYYEAALNKLN
jgi:tetratricopeptide (TPR) repeat protein